MLKSALVVMGTVKESPDEALGHRKVWVICLNKQVKKQIGTEAKALGKLSKDMWVKNHFRNRDTFRFMGRVCQITKDCCSFYEREKYGFLSAS